QRLLLLPVRSLTGTFAWVTSPYILHRLKRDMEDVGMDRQKLIVPDLPEPGEEKTDERLLCHISPESALTLKGRSDVYLDDLAFTAKEQEIVGSWADQIGKWVFSNA